MAEPRPEKSRKGTGLLALGRRMVNSQHALWGLGVASFLESILIPIPLEAILIPLMQVRRHQMFLLATIALVGCLVGAAVGYAVGYFMFEAIGPEIINMVSTEEQFQQVTQKMHENGFWFVLSVGVIPIPFQIAMLAAGVTGYSFSLFLLASTLSRGLRYFGLALLVLLVGNKAQTMFERHKVTSSVVVLLSVAAVWGVSFLAN